jgi:hypothetical protein
MFFLLLIFLFFITRTDSQPININNSGASTDLYSTGLKSATLRNNNSTGLLPDPSSFSAHAATAKPGYQNGTSELSKRISSTLARHGVEESANKRNSYVDNYSASMGTGGKDNSSSYSSNNNFSNGGDYSSNSLSWRRKLDEGSDNHEVTETKMVISRATSPQPDSSKQVRTRIAKETEPFSAEKKRSRQPRAYDVPCQTDPVLDFGLLSDYLRKVKFKKNYMQFCCNLNLSQLLNLNILFDIGRI